MDVLEGLNAEQRRAAEAVRGPVCILAGAGSGKTTTVTRRIAWQVASGAFAPRELLAVTFTDKAAGVMKARLAALGVRGVEARTFHAAALAQLHRYAPETVGRILPTKALLLRQIANALPPPYKFRPAADLATEIERAKARRVPPEDYLGSLDGHEPPIPPERMATVYREYERRKAARGEVDFEDLLELAIRTLETDEHARADLRDRYRAFTVDEYQDVNPLQQTLLDLWLGPRDDLCVVGDDYQSIYGFTGASPRWLLGLSGRFPHATVVRLEDNYRSSPQVLELANRLVPRLGGAEKTLRPTRTDGPEPVARAFGGADAEGAWVTAEIRRLRDEGVPLEEMAVLCRTNARLADFEELLHEAGLPFQGSSLLGRDAARRLLRALARDDSTAVAARVRALAEEAGWKPVLPDRLGERELTRQADLGRLVRLAEELDDGELTCAGFADELRRRFDAGGEGARGVHLLTYHRAKGLEFDAVFLPRLEDKELPSRFARTPEERAEERRLLYVGITRARTWLALTWSRAPSPFIAELGLGAAAVRGGARTPAAARPERDRSPAAEALRRWRLDRARSEQVPAYVVFPDRTIDELLARRPRTRGELAAIHGLGPSRLGRFGEELLALLAGLPQAGDAPPAADRSASEEAAVARSGPTTQAAVTTRSDLAVKDRAVARNTAAPRAAAAARDGEVSQVGATRNGPAPPAAAMGRDGEVQRLWVARGAPNAQEDTTTRDGSASQRPRVARGAPDAQEDRTARSGPAPQAAAVARGRPASTRPAGAAADVYDALADWRRRRARSDEVPPYLVFGNRVLAAIAEARPASLEELLAVPGVGPAKLDRYGAEVLEVVATRC